MAFDSNGLLYVGFGDRFDNSIRIQAQQLNSSLGKIIRINQDGSPAAGNPYLGNSAARPEIWSSGHRNPQGLAFNPVTGELFSSEHGPQAGDEINIIKPGSNYGWPIIAYGLEVGGQPVNGTGLTQQDGMEQPIYYWDPAIAPGGMTFYTGSQIPEWRNNLFVGAMGGMHIVRLVLNSTNNRVIGEERLLSGENQRFRHILQGPDGALYAISDHADGRIYRIGI
jgi:glucose/arabinose dehydrogenase